MQIIDHQAPSCEAYAWARLHGTLSDDVNGLGSTRIAGDTLSGTPTQITPAQVTRMMAPSTSLFWTAFVHAMLDRRDRVSAACLWTAIAMMLMIAGRVAIAKLGGL